MRNVMHYFEIYAMADLGFLRFNQMMDIYYRGKPYSIFFNYKIPTEFVVGRLLSDNKRKATLKLNLRFDGIN